MTQVVPVTNVPMDAAQLGIDPQAARSMLNNTLQNMAGLAQNQTLMRQELLRRIVGYGIERKLDEECGYPMALTPWDYRNLYDRESANNRVVGVMPDECWQEPCDVYDTEDPEDTDFEKAVKALEKLRCFRSYLHRIDVMSGIGSYGVLLYGIDDGLDLSKPVKGVKPDGTYSATPQERKLLFLRPFDEYLAPITKFETDTSNPRFGLPTEYMLRFTDPRATGATAQSQEMVASRAVHWSRILHVADNRGANEWCGTPRQQVCFNRLHDLRKVLGGSAEMFWKGGFPGYSIEVLPQVAEAGIKIDVEEIKEQVQAYMASLQRFLALTGVTAKSLAPQVADPETHIMAQYQAVALGIGVPLRVFLGTEEAVKAGDQDKASWNGRLRKRQLTYIDPHLVRPAYDMLIGLGCCPKPQNPEWFITKWKDLNSPSELDKSTTAKQNTEAMSTYVSGGVDALMAPKHYLTKVLGYDDETADAIIEEALTHVDDTGGGIVAQATAADVAQHPDAHPQPVTTVPAGTDRGKAAKALAAAKPPVKAPAKPAAKKK